MIMKMFIDGERCEASDGRTVDVLNSATQKFIDTVPYASPTDVERAIDAAQEGKRVWGAMAVHERSKILFEAASRIDAR